MSKYRQAIKKKPCDNRYYNVPKIYGKALPLKCRFLMLFMSFMVKSQFVLKNRIHHEGHEGKQTRNKTPAQKIGLLPGPVLFFAILLLPGLDPNIFPEWTAGGI